MGLDLGVEVAAAGEDGGRIVHLAGDVKGAREPVAQARGAVVEGGQVGGVTVDVLGCLGAQERKGVGSVHAVADGKVPYCELAASVELAATHIVDIARLLKHHLVGKGF